jgi:uncharacterized protein YllA (UPF0747 family)
LVELEKWFSKNDFPFQEVILIHLKNNKEREVIFHQFWPMMDIYCREKKFKMKDVVNFVKKTNNPIIGF